MKTWLKYSVAFFSFVVLLTVFIVVFGPGSYREAFRDGTPSIRIAQPHEIQNPGQPPSNK
jgi:hypothetical protein